MATKNTKHGMRFTRTYKSYDAMKQRCNNPNDPSFKWYGEKGITVCDRWLESFINFFDDMGERPSNTTLDRINNSLGYTKDNCKWSDKYEQSNNRKGITCVEINGVKKTISQWHAISGVTPCTISRRINNGVTGIAIIEPGSIKNIPIHFGSRTHTRIEWSEITGIPSATIHYRLSSGWSVERTLTQPVR